MELTKELREKAGNAYCDMIDRNLADAIDSVNSARLTKEKV